nr:hypothetical protein [Pseudoalteromonas sp. TB13]
MINENINFNDSFNAKATSKVNLVSSFISNAYYELLSSPNNSIMIGPRGSGKTTLLRMLDAEALDIWDKPHANAYREKISFSGVFVPTDRFWKTQYERFSKKYSQSNIFIKYLESTFLYHTLECLLQVVCYRTNRNICKKNNFRHISLSKFDEAELVQNLSHFWEVDSKIPSLRGLLIATSLKKQKISTFLSKGDDSEVADFKIIDGHLLSILEHSILVINEYLGEGDGKWAFLFDELELAPEELIQPLITAMRGGPQNIIFKLALSPYHQGVNITKDAFSGMNAEDLSIINLSGVRKDGFNFAKKLSENIFRKNNLNNDIESYFESSNKVNREKDLNSLMNKDESFKSYILRNELLFDNYEDLDSSKRDVYRRIQFNVHLRNYYMKNQDTKASRKAPPSYYIGFNNICSMLEYNPRMLVGIMNAFAAIAKENGKIKSNEQLESIKKYSLSFKSLLSTIAIDSTGNMFPTLFDIIDKIAKYFQYEIYSHDFNPDPVGSIKLNSKDYLNYIKAIGLALNSGALIIEKEKLDSFHEIDNIKNSRFRLSYLFAADYKLLLNNQRPIDLIKILNNTHIDVIDPSGKLVSQKELF